MALEGDVAEDARKRREKREAELKPEALLARIEKLEAFVARHEAQSRLIRKFTERTSDRAVCANTQCSTCKNYPQGVKCSICGRSER